MNRHVELIKASPLHFEPDGVWIRSNPEIHSDVAKQGNANFTVSTNIVNNFAKAECFRVAVSMPSGFSVQGAWTEVSASASVTAPELSWEVADLKFAPYYLK